MRIGGPRHQKTCTPYRPTHTGSPGTNQLEKRAAGATGRRQTADGRRQTTDDRRVPDAAAACILQVTSPGFVSVEAFSWHSISSSVPTGRSVGTSTSIGAARGQQGSSQRHQGHHHADHDCEWPVSCSIHLAASLNFLFIFSIGP